MILSDGLPALQTVIDRKQSFGEWALRFQDSMFLPYRDPNYSIESIVHLFMKRLHQPYSEVMKMPTSVRDKIFTFEKSIIYEENKR